MSLCERLRFAHACPRVAVSGVMFRHLPLDGGW